MDTIIQGIYKPCDPTNSNNVPVSSLIEFIKPYMPNNWTELQELHAELDPDDKNPGITYECFRDVMTGWIAKLQADKSLPGCSKALEEQDPVSSFFNLSLNQSATSNASLRANNNNIEGTQTEEKTSKLQLQLNKATVELNLVKQQLANAEEHNENLLMDLNRLNKKNDQGQHIVDEFNKNQGEAEEMKEAISAANKKMWKLERKLISYEKKQQGLLEQISQFETENANLKSKLKKQEKKKQEDLRSMNDMRDSIDVKDAEIATLMELLEELKRELGEKCELVNFHSNEHRLYKQRAQALENLVNEMAPGGTSTQKFNSPKLLNQLAHPVSPMVGRCTSSPIKNGNISELFSDVTTILRTPHKNLKDELSEASSDGAEEVKRLHQVLEEQENIKNTLWSNMKRLSIDNESLEEYKREYEELVGSMREKEEGLNVRINELETALSNEQQKFTKLLQEETKLVEELREAQEEKKRLLMELKRTEVKPAKEDKWCQSEEWVVPIPAANPDKKTNFTKQQLKFERLMEKKEKMEKEVCAERNINTTLEQKVKELEEECKLVKKGALSHEMKATECEKVIENLEMQLQDVVEANEALEEETHRLSAEKFQADQKLENALNQLAAESATIDEMSKNNKTLEQKHQQLCAKIKDDFMKQIRLKKQLIDMKSTYAWKILVLKRQLLEKDNEIEKLKQQMDVEKVMLFFSVNNRELSNIISICTSRLDLKHVLDGELLLEIDTLEKKPTTLDSGMSLLGTNIKLVILLFEIITDKFLSGAATFCISERDSVGGELSSMGDAEFLSCEMDTCLEKLPQVISVDCDSFLNDLELNDEDLMQLTRVKMEQKFNFLALALSLDIRTTNKRFLREKEHLDQLILKYYAYLNSTLHLAERFSRSERNQMIETVVSYLQIVKNMSEEMFKVAVTCGVLQYEKRTVNCWKLVVNYVAALRQESDKLKETRLESCENLVVPEIASPSSQGSRLKTIDIVPLSLKPNVAQKITVCVLIIFSIIVFLFVSLILYVDHICPKSTYVCPVQWLLDSMVEKTYTDHYV